MKMKREHVVPLAPRIVSRSLLKLCTSCCVAGSRSRAAQLSVCRTALQAALNAALKRMGYGKGEMCA